MSKLAICGLMVAAIYAVFISGGVVERAETGCRKFPNLMKSLTYTANAAVSGKDVRMIGRVVCEIQP